MVVKLKPDGYERKQFQRPIKSLVVTLKISGLFVKYKFEVMFPKRSSAVPALRMLNWTLALSPCVACTRELFRIGRGLSDC